MNIQQFQYILAVVEHKHFETAAESCFITQSTLSTMINKFEDEIGIKIFNRKTKPVSITKEGTELIQKIRIIKKEIDSLNNLTQELKGETVGELKVGIIPTIATDLLPLFLSDFSNQFPKVKIIVQEITTSEIQKGLKNRTLDVGILAIPISDKELIELDLYVEPFLMFDCSLTKNKIELKIEELDYSNLWLLEEGHCLRTQVQQICDLSNNKEAKNIEFKAGSLGSLLRFTKANKGATILPYLSSLELSKKDKENLISFKAPVPVRSIGLITHQHFVKKKLLNHLQKTIKLAVKPLISNSLEVKILNPI